MQAVNLEKRIREILRKENTKIFPDSNLFIPPLLYPLPRLNGTDTTFHDVFDALRYMISHEAPNKKALTLIRESADLYFQIFGSLVLQSQRTYFPSPILAELKRNFSQRNIDSRRNWIQQNKKLVVPAREKKFLEENKGKKSLPEVLEVKAECEKYVMKFLEHVPIRRTLY